MISTSLREGVFAIELDNPPVNALRECFAGDLVDALAEAGRANARAILFFGSGRLFSGGADVREFGKTTRTSWLQEAIGLVEGSPIPTIAAMHGAALGGGLELALGCHYRIATDTAQLALPEVKLGILPGAGGSQRLPRLVGLGVALRMIAAGETISGQEGLEIGLIDTLLPLERWKEAAFAFAQTVDRPRRTSDLPAPVDTGEIDAFAKTSLQGSAILDAPSAALEALRAAATLSYSDGLAREQELVDGLLNSPQAQALQHVFFAERAAATIHDVPKSTSGRKIETVGVIGAGTMGAGIAVNFLLADLPVRLMDVDQVAVSRGVAAVDRMLDASVRKARLTPEQAASARSHLSTTLSLDDLHDRDLIIEAVFEDISIKTALFAKLDAISREGAILASNTSFLDIDVMALATHRPRDVLGLHFFSPANIMKLVEVVRGQQTAPDVLATAVQLCRKIGKVPVISRVGYGFIANRMVTPRQQQAYALLVEGATPEQIDRVHTDFGLPMGPFQVEDLAGVDVGWHRDPQRVETIRDALCTAGRCGQKVGAGFYDYDDRRKPIPSSVTEGIVGEFRRKAGVEPREIGDDEIRVRTLFTMINEGAEVLREGIAQRAADIDVAMVLGYGWPRHTGGPMYWADRYGLRTILDGLTAFQRAMGDDFIVSPLLAERAAGAGSFASST